mmetsp:Transcript_21963/g.37057  ORF Transcript_21963/g.37057 Transcript_21963/m.37057 type:complete len:99 (-) Transcript_21963:2154-2450(-)
MPIWCKLNSQWFDHREDTRREEAKCLFAQMEVDGSEANGRRPTEFPEDLWPLVLPDQRKLVEGRFRLFKGGLSGTVYPESVEGPRHLHPNYLGTVSRG